MPLVFQFFVLNCSNAFERLSRSNMFFAIVSRHQYIQTLLMMMHFSDATYTFMQFFVSTNTFGRFYISLFVLTQSSDSDEFCTLFCFLEYFELHNSKRHQSTTTPCHATWVIVQSPPWCGIKPCHLERGQIVFFILLLLITILSNLLFEKILLPSLFPSEKTFTTPSTRGRNFSGIPRPWWRPCAHHLDGISSLFAFLHLQELTAESTRVQNSFLLAYLVRGDDLAPTTLTAFPASSLSSISENLQRHRPVVGTLFFFLFFFLFGVPRPWWRPCAHHLDSISSLTWFPFPISPYQTCIKPNINYFSRATLLIRLSLVLVANVASEVDPSTQTRLPRIQIQSIISKSPLVPFTLQVNK